MNRPIFFWPVFIQNWPMCDASWGCNARLVKTLGRVGPCSPDQYSAHVEDGGAFFDCLEDQITVYRGASRSRIHGAISRTTDLDVARRFARGHRGIAVPDPVIAIGVIDKAAVFLATNDRREFEIVGLPRVFSLWTPNEHNHELMEPM
jgi:hypothetical protein